MPPEVPKFGRLGLAGRNLLNSAISRGVFSALFPSDCRLCGVPLSNISRLPVCEACLLAMTPISGVTCEVCGERLGLRAATNGNQLCLMCRGERPHFTKAIAYGAYDGELRELIHLLKYERVEPAANVLGRMLAEATAKLTLKSASVLVIAVPLHRSKRRERGFNQAELIARAALKQNPIHGAELDFDAFERVRLTVSQVGLTRAQRADNMRGAFRVKHLNRVAGREILLVDDVLTTGTTANECARVLRKAGAEEVWVATVARTLKESDATTTGLKNFEAAMEDRQEF